MTKRTLKQIEESLWSKLAEDKTQTNSRLKQMLTPTAPPPAFRQEPTDTEKTVAGFLPGVGTAQDIKDITQGDYSSIPYAVAGTMIPGLRPARKLLGKMFSRGGRAADDLSDVSRRVDPTFGPTGSNIPPTVATRSAKEIARDKKKIEKELTRLRQQGKKADQSKQEIDTGLVGPGGEPLTRARRKGEILPGEEVPSGTPVKPGWVKRAGKWAWDNKAAAATGLTGTAGLTAAGLDYIATPDEEPWDPLGVPGRMLQRGKDVINLGRTVKDVAADVVDQNQPYVRGSFADPHGRAGATLPRQSSSNNKPAGNAPDTKQPGNQQAPQYRPPAVTPTPSPADNGDKYDLSKPDTISRRSTNSRIAEAEATPVLSNKIIPQDERIAKRLQQLSPSFVDALNKALEEYPGTLRVSSANRTPEEQKEIRTKRAAEIAAYMKKKTEFEKANPGQEYKAKKPNPAAAELAAHAGYALDMNASDLAKLHRWLRKEKKEGRDHGLETGLEWKDRDDVHLQLRNWQLAQAKDTVVGAGKKAIEVGKEVGAAVGKKAAEVGAAVRSGVDSEKSQIDKDLEVLKKKWNKFTQRFKDDDKPAEPAKAAPPVPAEPAKVAPAAPAKATPAAQPADKVSSQPTNRFATATDKEPEQPANSSKVTAAPADVPTVVSSPGYQVKKGDTLTKIAKNSGVELKDLIAANPQIKNPNLIQVGDNVSIPGNATKLTRIGQVPSTTMPDLGKEITSPTIDVDQLQRSYTPIRPVVKDIVPPAPDVEPMDMQSQDDSDQQDFDGSDLEYTDNIDDTDVDEIEKIIRQRTNNVPASSPMLESVNTELKDILWLAGRQKR